MLSAGDLKGVKLRSVSSVPAVEHSVSLLDSVQRELDQNARLRAVDLEAWYDALKTLTYPTTFVPLSIAQARALVDVYWQIKKSTQRDSLTLDSIQQIVSDSPHANVLSVLTSNIQQGMKELHSTASTTASSQSEPAEAEVSDDAKAVPPKQSASVFAKLSSRSPKDSLLRTRRAREIVLGRLAAVKGSKQCVDVNDIGCALMSASVECLELSSAQEVLCTFLTSDRVCEDDLPLALGFKTWSQHIVLRQWIHIPIQFEFRGFVYNNRLTALSQYFTNGYFPDLVAQKAKCLQLVTKAFEDMRDIVPVEPKEYVVDFAVDISAEKAFVIELNPFGPPDGMGTGTCMFDITKENDRDVLFGRAPFEFRIETCPVKDGDKLIRGPWREFLKEKGYLT